MTLSDNKTGDLWKNFMRQRNKITNNLTSEMISMQLYDQSIDFEKFNQDTSFEKWSAIEVPYFQTVPDGMETFILISGLYAVFVHKGPASSGDKTFKFIFETWLPDSGYTIDNRPHFEILGDKYKHENHDSEEEVWIPVKLKV
jgi:AraC family transcriptional regulator